MPTVVIWQVLHATFTAGNCSGTLQLLTKSLSAKHEPYKGTLSLLPFILSSPFRCLLTITFIDLPFQAAINCKLNHLLVMSQKPL